MASRKIEDLHPLMQPIAREFLQRIDDILGSYQAFITDGFRSNEEQTELYAQGRTKPGKIVTYAQAGQSPHNYGLAIDIAFRPDGSKKAEWNMDMYRRIEGLARELGLTWGGSWSNFKDNPHYELRNWKEIINNKGENNMPGTEDWKGLDYNNRASMLAAVTTWAEVRDGKYVAAEEVETIKKQLAAQKGEVTKRDKQIESMSLELEALKNKPVQKAEAIKDPLRYLVSMAVGALLTYLYTKYPIFGQLQPDQQAVATVLVGMVLKGIDKYQHEMGSSFKLPF